MNATDILAYTYNGELLCAEHGAKYDNGEDDGAYPIFADTSEFCAVEYCSAMENGQHLGHSFCMSCGADVDAARGSHDADVNGHFARCWNCGTESVYVDGAGYDRLAGMGRWADVLETHKVQVYGVPTGAGADQNGYTSITAVLDEAGRTMHRLCSFAVYLEHSPVDGCVLVLANSWDEAYDAGAEHFTDEVAADEVDDIRADVQCWRVSTDQVWFREKR